MASQINRKEGKPRPSATLPSTNLTRTDMGPNKRGSDDKPVKMVGIPAEE